MKTKKNTIKLISAIFFLATAMSCTEFLEIDTPRTDLVRSTVFDSDITADAAMVDVYVQLAGSSFANGGASSVTFLGALSASEFQTYAGYGDINYQQLMDHTVKPNNSYVTGSWSKIYTIVYATNAVIEGLTKSTNVTPAVKSQLLGEAHFIRAFCYFYLVNLWGDVPLVLTTDYRTNNIIVRSSANEVYQQIVADLKDAYDMLPNNYSFSSNQRVRATKWAAAALLARTYLFTKSWAAAEASATELISNPSLYSLEANLTNVFKITSREAIWQLWSVRTPSDRNTFFADNSGPYYGSFRQGFVNQFETGDARRSTWVKSVTVSGVTYVYALKYSDASAQPQEFSTVMRLAEQYLIRAEARAMQNNFTDATSDINAIRSRAGLPGLAVASQAAVLDAIMRERNSEYFTEWAHRWLDLKRTNRLDAEMSALDPAWNSRSAFFPIPEVQIVNSPLTTQNPY